MTQDEPIDEKNIQLVFTLLWLQFYVITFLCVCFIICLNQDTNNSYIAIV